MPALQQINFAGEDRWPSFLIMWRALLLLICLPAFQPAPYFAQTMTASYELGDVLAAYEDGRFQDAADFAVTIKSADAYAVAARALLAVGIVENRDPTNDELDRAEAFARQAIGLAPRHAEGRLQLAIALSMRTRSMSRVEAWQSGYGQRARTLAEGVIMDEPENAYADGFLSVWHTEAVRIGGGFGASFVGASIKKGRAHYERANEINPDDVGLHWQYARSLTLLNAKKHRREIDLALSRALAAGQDNAVEAVFYERAYTLNAALSADEVDAALAFASAQL